MFPQRVESRQRLPALVMKPLALRHLANPIDAEHPKVVPQFAPGYQCPDLAPEPQTQRADCAVRRVARLVGIGQLQQPPPIGRGFDAVQECPRSVVEFRHLEGMDLNGLGADAGVIGQDRADFDQRFLGGLRHRRAAPGSDQEGTGDEGHDFVPCEHQWRQVKRLPHQIADTGLAIEGHAGADQVGNVAIDGAFADFKLFGQLPRGGQPTAPRC